MPAQDNPYLHRAFDRAELYRQEAARLMDQFLASSNAEKDERDIINARRMLRKQGDAHAEWLKYLGK